MPRLSNTRIPSSLLSLPLPKPPNGFAGPRRQLTPRQCRRRPLRFRRRVDDITRNHGQSRRSPKARRRIRCECPSCSGSCGAAGTHDGLPGFAWAYNGFVARRRSHVMGCTSQKERAFTSRHRHKTTPCNLLILTIPSLSPPPKPSTPMNISHPPVLLPPAPQQKKQAKCTYKRNPPSKPKKKKKKNRTTKRREKGLDATSGKNHEFMISRAPRE